MTHYLQVMQVCASQRVQIQPEAEESTLEHDGSLNIEDHLTGILNFSITMAISKLCNPLQTLLTKLNKFDPSEGFLASLKMMVGTLYQLNKVVFNLSLSLPPSLPPPSPLRFLLAFPLAPIQISSMLTSPSSPLT